MSGALVVGFAPENVGAQGAAGPAGQGFTPYIRIGSDGKVTILSAHMDMGQGIYPRPRHAGDEELRADWSQIDVIGGSGDPKVFGNLDMGRAIQGTGGSTGIVSRSTV